MIDQSLSSLAGKYYVGSSENPQRRLSYHNTIEKGFTSRYRPWSLIWSKEYPSKVEAQLVESKIKSWKSRVMIEKVINEEVNI
ncbi:MAG: GIY-YIG nuclease family protein [Ignavibacteriales bacterium]|nr:GIY-YIG nuclease family protein [Ignavibacteriales bacterium]